MRRGEGRSGRARPLRRPERPGRTASVSDGRCRRREHVARDGSTVFNGATLGAGSEARINGTGHLRSNLPEGGVVPNGWVAVGDPAEILPPNANGRIWELQEPLDFPGTVFGVEREPPDELVPKLTERYAAYLERHRADTVVEAADDAADR